MNQVRPSSIPTHDEIWAACPQTPFSDFAPRALSPSPFRLGQKQYVDLQRLGEQLRALLRACNDLYSLSAAGRQPAWIAELIDQGKPADLISMGRVKTHRNELPRLIRAEVGVTEDGYEVSHLGTVPWDSGLAVWLNQTYSACGFRPLEGPFGLLEQVKALAPAGDLLVGHAGKAAAPELEWLATQSGQRIRAIRDFHAQTEPARALRFFEISELTSTEEFSSLHQTCSLRSDFITAPLKPQLDERVWLALLRVRSLRDFWRRSIGDRLLEPLLKNIPRTWVLDPRQVPPQAEIPELGVRGYEELALLSAPLPMHAIRPSTYERPQLLSGLEREHSPVLGASWKNDITGALSAFFTKPHVLQRTRAFGTTPHAVFSKDLRNTIPTDCLVKLVLFFSMDEAESKLQGGFAQLFPSTPGPEVASQSMILAPLEVLESGSTVRS